VLRRRLGGQPAGRGGGGACGAALAQPGWPKRQVGKLASWQVGKLAS
jgi:hypothetical protein